MKFTLSLLALIAVTSFNSAASADEPLPVIEVQVRTVPGTFTGMVSGSLEPKLLHELQAHFVDVVKKEISCMDWQKKGAASTQPNSRPRLILEFSREERPLKVYLSYRASVDNSFEQEVLRSVVIDTLQDNLRPYGFGKVQPHLSGKIAAHVLGDELKSVLNRELIRQISLTSKTDADAGRLVVPLNACRMRLKSNSLLLLTIKEEHLCGGGSANCEVALLCLGPSNSPLFKDQLLCNLERSNCCQLTPETARRLRETRSKDVYLDADHKHLSRLQSSCRPDGIARSMSTTR